VSGISSVDGLARQRVSDEEYEACLAGLYALPPRRSWVSYGGVDIDVASRILNGPALF
jgi:hypothetical protein